MVSGTPSPQMPDTTKGLLNFPCVSSHRASAMPACKTSVTPIGVDVNTFVAVSIAPGAQPASIAICGLTSTSDATRLPTVPFFQSAVNFSGGTSSGGWMVTTLASASTCSMVSYGPLMVVAVGVTSTSKPPSGVFSSVTVGVMLTLNSWLPAANRLASVVTQSGASLAAIDVIATSTRSIASAAPCRPPAVNTPIFSPHAVKPA